MMPGELEKLRERVRKDPFSRSFISLADELNKAGMRTEAIRVLWDGLERQPGYMSARVALGKLYIEENNLDGALSEFRRVAGAIPDNLFAQRKLADIYMQLGDKDGARRALEMVVRLNPMDRSAKAALDKLTGAQCDPQSDSLPPAESDPLPSAPPPGGRSQEGNMEQAGTAEEEAWGGIEIAGDVKQVGAEGEAGEGEGLALAEALIQPDENSPAEKISGGTAPEEVSPEAGWTRLLDSMIEGDDYGGAFVYLRKRLESHPDETETLQRLEELKTLVKLLGLEDSVRVSLLDAFLQSARRKKEKNRRNSDG